MSNEPLDIEVAFEQVIHTRGIYKVLGINSNTVKTLRFNYKQQKVSIHKMREVLVLAGYKLHQVEQWVRKDEK